MSELVEEQGERQNSEKQEQVDGRQGEADIEIVQQIEIVRFSIADGMTQDDLLHLNGHALLQPVFVQVIRLASQIQIGLLGLQPLNRKCELV